MANQVIVTANNTVQVAIEPTPQVQVQISRTSIGNISVNNVANANYANFAGNIVGNLGNLTVTGTTTTGNLIVLGNLQVGNLVANTANYANFAGEVVTNAQPNITSVGTLTGLSVNSNTNVTLQTTASNIITQASANNFLKVVNTSNVAGTVQQQYYNTTTEQGSFVGASDTGINISIANTNPGNSFPTNLKSAWRFDTTGNLAHLIGGVGNINAKGANLGSGNVTAGRVTASGNVQGNIVTANWLYGDGGNISNIPVGNITGIGNIATINLDGNVSNALLGDGTWGPVELSTANTVTDNAQPNITSVGNLTSLTVIGNINANTMNWTNTLVYTGSLASNDKITMLADLPGAQTVRNLGIRAGNVTTVSASNTVPGGIFLSSGGSLNSNASVAWIARSGPAQLLTGTANTANGNAQSGGVGLQPGAAFTSNGIAIGGTSSLIAGQAGSANGNATSGGLNIGFAFANATNGTATLAAINVGNGIAVSSNGNIAVNSMNFGNAYGNAVNGNVSSFAMNILGTSTRTNGSGNSTAGSINITAGNARSENGNATSGNINIQTPQATVAAGSGTATVGSINIEVGTPTGITGNVKGNINIATNGQANAVNIGANINANIINATYLYGDGSNISNIAGGSAAGNTTEVQFNNGGAFGASNALTFNSGANLLTVNGTVNAINGVYSGTAGGAIQTNIDNVVNCPDITFNRYDNNSYINNYSVYRAQGTPTSPAPVQPGDYLFSIYNSAYSNVGYEYAATSTYSTIVNTNDGAGNITVSSQYGAATIPGSDFNINYGLFNAYGDIIVGSGGSGNLSVPNGNITVGNDILSNIVYANYVSVNSNTVGIDGANRSLTLNGQGLGSSNTSAFTVNNGTVYVNMDNVPAIYASFQFATYEDTNGFINPYTFYRARGNSSSPNNTQAGDAVKAEYYNAYGDSGNTYVALGSTIVIVKNNDNAGNVSATMQFQTANNNDGSEIALNTDIINLNGNITTPYTVDINSNISLYANGRMDYLRTFGSFTSNATQTSNGANTTNYMTFNNTEDANGISIANSTEITVARPGRYNIQFSAQLEKTDAGTDLVEIWLVKNGSGVANSATQLRLTGNGAKDVAAWDFNVNAANVNDYFELAWASPDINVQLTAIDTANTISGIAVPSVIVDINPIGA